MKLRRADDPIRRRPGVPFAGFGQSSLPRYPFAVEKPTETQLTTVNAFFARKEALPTHTPSFADDGDDQ